MIMHRNMRGNGDKIMILVMIMITANNIAWAATINVYGLSWKMIL